MPVKASSDVELLNMTLPADPKFVGFARRAVSGVLHQLKFDKSSSDDIILAVGEAANNAVAYPGEVGGGSIYIVCRLIPLPGATALQKGLAKSGTLQIDIRNHGDKFAQSIDDSRYEMPSAELLGEHGRGLPLMMAFLDRVQVLSENGDTIVRLEKALPSES